MVPLAGVLAALLPLILMVSSTPINSSPFSIGNGSLQVTPKTELHWTKCERWKMHLECANMTVPMNWNDPRANETINLALARRRCRNSDSRIGTLLFNPGGPGLGAIHYLQLFSKNLFDRFDIVAMDPRGVGESTQINCPDKPNFKGFPTTDDEYKALIELNSNAAMACYNKTGEIIKYMDSASVARDFEALRVALGGEKLNFYGSSYGTVIAATYAELFPDNYRAIIMDGVADSTISKLEESMRSAFLQQQAFDWFVSWCESDSTCELHGRDVHKSIHTAIDRAGGDAGCLQNYMAHMLIKGTYAKLGEALAMVIEQDRMLAEMHQDCHSESSYGDVDMDWLAIRCGDSPLISPNVSEFAQLQQALEAKTPYVAKAPLDKNFGTACVGWPFLSLNPPHPLKFPSGIPPILVVNSLYDPKTSYVNAVSMHKQIPNSVLLTTHTEGHCVYDQLGDSSASRMMEEYLINLKLPKPDTIVDA